MNKLYIVLLAVLSTSLMADETFSVEKMKSLDAEIFELFNQCEDPKALSKYASYFSTDVEFYHDNGGATWDRDSMISNTQKNVCGNYTRKLVAGTFKSYGIKGFGAITEGVHIFCQKQTQKCEGKADFVMIWHNTNDKWKVI